MHAFFKNKILGGSEGDLRCRRRSTAGSFARFKNITTWSDAPRFLEGVPEEFRHRISPIAARNNGGTFIGVCSRKIVQQALGADSDKFAIIFAAMKRGLRRSRQLRRSPFGGSVRPRDNVSTLQTVGCETSSDTGLRCLAFEKGMHLLKRSD